MTHYLAPTDEYVKPAQHPQTCGPCLPQSHRVFRFPRLNRDRASLVRFRIRPTSSLIKNSCSLLKLTFCRSLSPPSLVCLFVFDESIRAYFIMSTMAVSWDKPQHTNLTLWDIDREFQDAHEAYEQWQARHRRTRSKWACFGTKNRDDAVGKALSLGRQVQRIMEQGKERFGARFEEGDSKCNIRYGSCRD